MVKRNRRKSSSTTEDDDAVYRPMCSHVKESINISFVRRALQKATKMECASCAKEKAANSESKSTSQECAPVVNGEVESSLIASPIWVCLFCGEQSCGRQSPGQHALKHSEKPRSDSHVLAYSPCQESVWCYKCDEEVYPERMHQLRDLCGAVQKWYRGFNTSNETDTSEATSREKMVNGDGVVSELVASSPRGLQNLGNTCYFNSVLQCLARTPGLLSVLRACCVQPIQFQLAGCSFTLPPGDDDDDESDSEEKQPDVLELDPLDLEITSSPGNTTNALAGVISDLLAPMKGASTAQKGKRATPNSNANVVSPQELRLALRVTHRRFGGYAQQDSHELLRALQDTIKLEEVNRMRTAILARLNLKTVSDRKMLNNTQRQTIRQYGRLAQDATVMDRVFGGFLISTVTCCLCHTPSQTFEHFLDISLPVATLNKGGQVNNHCGWGNKEDSPSPVKADNKSVSKHQNKKANKLSKKQKRALQKKKEKGVAEEDIQENPEKDAPTPSDDVIKSDENTSAVKTDETNDVTGSSDVIGEGKHDSADLVMTNEDIISLSTASLQLEADDVTSVDEGGELPKDSSEENGLESQVNGHADDVYLTSGSNDVTFEQAVDVENGGDTSNTSEFITANCGGDCQENGTEKDVSDELKDVDGVNVDGVNVDDVNVELLTDETEVTSNGVETCESHDVDVGDTVTSLTSALVSSLSIQDDLEDPVLDAKAKQRLAAQIMAQELLGGQSGDTMLEQCMSQFTSPELLSGSNQVVCEACSRRQKVDKPVYRDAKKRYLVYSPPPVLTIHLKRFQQCGSNLVKVKNHVSFPLVLDISPYCSRLAQNVQSCAVYRLYGLVEHSGSLNGGHYVAYVCARNPDKDPLSDRAGLSGFMPRGPLAQPSVESIVGRYECPEWSDVEKCEAEDKSGRVWFHVSDSSVSQVAETRVMSCQAYILFYERIL